MRSLALVSLVILALMPQQRAGAPVQKLATPEARTIAGYSEASCVGVIQSLLVCKGRGTSAGMMEVFLYVDGKPAMTWPSGPPAFGGVFDVRLADLDADGRDELVVTDHLTSSNGMVVTDHRSIIVRHFEDKSRTAIRFDHQEFCSDCDAGTLVSRRPKTGMSIFAAEWMWDVSTLDPGRPSGNYVLGRWLAYRDSRLTPEPEIMARRYLRSLESLRHDGTPNAPVSWFSGVFSRPIARHPALGDGTVIGIQAGVIEAAGTAPADGLYAIRGKGSASGQYYVRGQAESPGANWHSVDAVGLRASRLVLPRGVSPELVMGLVVGRPIAIHQYRDGTLTRRVLWIE